MEAEPSRAGNDEQKKESHGLQTDGASWAQEAQGPLAAPPDAWEASQRSRQVSGHSQESWGGQAAAAHPAWGSGPTRQGARFQGAGLRTRAGGQETGASHWGAPAPHPPQLMRPAHGASLALTKFSHLIPWSPGSPALPGVLGARQGLGAPT